MNKDVPVASRGHDRQEAFWTLMNRKAAELTAGTIQRLLESEQQDMIGAGWNERKTDRAAWRNGFRRRRLTTPQGVLHVKIPRCRHGGIDCSAFFDRYQRRVADVDRILRHAYLAGASTRAVAQLSEQVFGGTLSHQTVSRLMRWLDEQLAAWREAPIEPVYRVVYLDGMYVSTLDGKRVVMLAAGLRADGQLDVLGFCVSTGERCVELLADLRRRGLEGVELFVSDESASIRSALAQTYPEVTWQHCTFHRLAALRASIGQTEYRREMVREASDIFRCPSQRAAVEQASAWAGRWRERNPWAVRQFLTDLADSLRFYNMPKDLWKRARTNNPMERIIRTLRMRLRNMGCFHDPPSVERAVFGQLAHRRLLGTYTQ
jgi:transposase-like protein